MIKSENYLVIQGWMITELELKGNDLLVYAIIYGFSQDENNKFTGSLQYLADWCKSSKRGVQKNIQNLLEKGLITKKEVFKNNIKFCEYYVTQFYGIEQSSCGYGTEFARGMELSSTNNINNINNININNISELDKAFSNFEEMRKKIKKPLTDNARELILKKLNKLANSDAEKIEILNQSTMNCWQGIFPLKQEFKGNNTNTNNTFNITKFDV